ncbi:hypothetical protein D3C80_195350 [compost metagenome]
MKITKGLVVDDPWIGYILDGSKTWEMRSRRVSYRGWFGLIRKGTGMIYGVARLIDVRPPLSVEEMVAAYERHRIPENMIRAGVVAKWTTPWVLADVRPFSTPVPYRHPSGAVSWVELDPQVTDAIATQLDLVSMSGVVPISNLELSEIALLASRSATTAFPQMPIPKTEVEVTSCAPPEPLKRDEAPTRMVAPVDPTAKLVLEVEITEANLTHNHFYLREHLHRFPNEIIGGSNASKLARREARIDWGGPEVALTDIDGERHKFFRRRGWIGRFYQLNRAKPGDLVSLEETGPLTYRVRIKKGTA